MSLLTDSRRCHFGQTHRLRMLDDDMLYPRRVSQSNSLSGPLWPSLKVCQVILDHSTSHREKLLSHSPQTPGVNVD